MTIATIATASVFMSGNSQAVRLPKAFWLNTPKVTIESRGDEIVIRPKRPTVRELLLRKRKQPDAATRAAWEEVEALIAQDAASQTAQERDWNALWG